MGQGSLLIPPEMIVVARIGAPFGVLGWVHAQSFTDPSDNLFHYSELFLSDKEDAGKENKDHWKPAKIRSFRPHGKHWVLKLENCDNREAAMKLTNHLIAIPREILPKLPPGEFYWADLLGLEVFTENDQYLGVVKELFSTGANDVLVVQGDMREHLIPYVEEDYIKEINLEARKIVVDWDPEF